MSDHHPTENSTALIVGGEIKTVGMSVAGRLFVFTPHQMQFLINLNRLKEPAAAALSIGKDETWGKAFLASRKFRTYLSCKMQEYSVKSGLTVEWWYQFGRWMVDGFKEEFQVSCQYCEFSGTLNQYEVETHRMDDMQLDAQCPSCFKSVQVSCVKEPFKPSREQVETWKEFGARLIPKVERVHHQFEKSDIVFEGEES